MSDRPSFTVFYSWQSDLEGKANRNLIGEALERAAKTLRDDDSLHVEPVMDRDTAGLPGSPDIAATIFDKINAANAFVADVSFITPPTCDGALLRRCPNPNVLLELGYALHRHGEQRTLLVLNEHYGPVADLPFDLRNRRVMRYRCSPDEPPAEARKALQATFEVALRAMMNEPVLLIPGPTRAAIEAVEAQRPNRASLVREAVAAINGRLQRVAPDLAKDRVDPDAFIAGLDAATPALAEYLELARVAASMDDHGAVVELVVGLEPVARGHFLPPGVGGTVRGYQFEYWKQVGYELLLGLVALLLRERRFAMLGELVRTPLNVPNVPGVGNDSVTVAYLNPRGWSQQAAWSEGQFIDGGRHISPVGELLRQRYETAPLASVASWSELQAADLFLYIWATVKQGRRDPGVPPWFAHAAVLLTEPPRFLIEAIRVGPARQVAEAVGLPTPEALRDLYVDRVSGEAVSVFPEPYRLSGLNFPVAHKIGSVP